MRVGQRMKCPECGRNMDYIDHNIEELEVEYWKCWNEDCKVEYVQVGRRIR